MTASWFVRYRDGTEDWQYNTASPHFHQDGGEVPYRAIDWPQVETLVFESQFVRRDFAVTPVPDGFKTTMHSRHFTFPTGENTSCFLVVVSEVDKTPREGAVTVLYWFPDDTMHECHLYDCPEVAAYGCAVVNGVVPTLVPTHGLQQLAADAAVA